MGFIDEWLMKFCYPNVAMDDAAIFNLNFDCFEAIFDCLLITDLYALAQTCKLLNQMVSLYFYNNLTSAILLYSSNGSYLTEYNLVINDVMILRSKVLIENNHLHFFHCMKNSNWTLKTIHFIGVNFSDPKISIEKHILRQIESIEIIKSEFNGNLYRNLLKYCRNLKRLSVQFPKIINNKKWLLKKYPNLEHIELRGCFLRIKDLIKFFKKNPHVQSFNGHLTIDDLDELANNSSVRLDELHIHLELSAWLRFETTEILNRLHEKSLYKRLNLSFHKEISQTIINQISSLNALDTLHITLRSSRGGSIDLSPLENVKSLDLEISSDIIIHIKSIAQHLKNLERIRLGSANAALISGFVLHSKKLREIVIQRVWEDVHLSLENLNERRKKITKQKVTIFVDERFFLKTKYSSGRIKFDLIEIRRF